MTPTLESRKQAKEDLKAISRNPGNVLIIHYSCEGLGDHPDGRSNRVTSIAVKRFDNGQAESFSLHREAELAGIPYPEIAQNLDILEKGMLTKFYEFVQKHPNHRWVHWNMRDSTFGFQAIEHRAKVFQLPSEQVEDKNKTDLSRTLINIYGKHYIGHPRQQSILELNQISTLHFMTGEMEAEAFKEGKFIDMHRSTLRKVACHEELLRLTLAETLKTKSRFWHIYGLSPKGLVLFIKEHWIWSGIGIIATTLGLLKVFGIIGTNAGG